jgi:hypothetical protein
MQASRLRGGRREGREEGVSCVDIVVPVLYCSSCPIRNLIILITNMSSFFIIQIDKILEDTLIPWYLCVASYYMDTANYAISVLSSC